MMTPTERARAVFLHRMALGKILQMRGYDPVLVKESMNYYFIGKQPTQEEYDKATFAAYKFLQEELGYKNLELLELLW